MDEILRDTIIGEATREIPKGSHHTREMRRQLLTIIINYLVDETRYEIKKLYWDGILSMDKIKKFGEQLEKKIERSRLLKRWKFSRSFFS